MRKARTSKRGRHGKSPDWIQALLLLLEKELLLSTRGRLTHGICWEWDRRVSVRGAWIGRMPRCRCQCSCQCNREKEYRLDESASDGMNYQASLTIQTYEFITILE